MAASNRQTNSRRCNRMCYRNFQHVLKFWLKPYHNPGRTLSHINNIPAEAGIICPSNAEYLEQVATHERGDSNGESAQQVTPVALPPQPPKMTAFSVTPDYTWKPPGSTATPCLPGLGIVPEHLRLPTPHLSPASMQLLSSPPLAQPTAPFSPTAPYFNSQSHTTVSHTWPQPFPQTPVPGPRRHMQIAMWAGTLENPRNRTKYMALLTIHPRLTWGILMDLPPNHVHYAAPVQQPKVENYLRALPPPRGPRYVRIIDEDSY
ncbi:hypothetical protein Slin14017_G110500 [Septoria linicola]|nr:hypothetical protein Slin14017_G110500 [Septoria linicola]